MSQVLQVNGDYLVKVSDGGTITLNTGNKVGDVVVSGNLIVDNNLTIKGNLTLGDAGDDNVLLLGEISSDLIPKIGNVYDLGSERKQWSSLYISQILNPLGGVTIKNLVEPLNPQDAATKNYVDTILGKVDNVFYVAKSGNDLNDGRTLGKAKLTIKAAVEAARQDIANGYDATVFVKSGDYTEDNPIRLPEKLSIWGDTLRATTVRPLNKQQDLFWVTNGNYLAQMTFKDHEAPASAVAFAPPTEEYPAVAIHTSPYVQNCTSITTTGCGMRVDGAYTKGLKSMVVDAYTQYNQGGVGIHMLNRGNTQLVSAFTINCDIAFLCTAGGFCSLTNSNSSFGNFGLVADGVSEALYSGVLTGSKIGIIGDTVILNNLNTRPNVGDAVSFNGSTNFYTVTIASELSAGDIVKSQPNFSNQPVEYRTVRQLIRAAKDKISIDTIDYVNEEYRDLNYNQFKCTRDTLLIIDAAIDDAALNTNYKSIQAGMAYSRLSASVVRDEQLAESTDALLFTKSEALDVISSDSTIQGEEYQRINGNFDLIYTLFSAASANTPPTPPAYEFNAPVGATPEQVNARDIIIANREFLIQEGIAYIEQNLSFNYDKALCQRDVGLIIDAVGYDLMFGSNFRSITAGRSYYRAQASTVVGAQKTATIDAFNFLKTVLTDLVLTDTAAYESVELNMNLIIDIIDQGLSAVPPEYTIPNPTEYNDGYNKARNLIDLNREFIKAEIVKFIADNYPEPGFVYDQVACERDIDLILDAVYYDITYGGNLETLIAGNAYYAFGSTSVIPGEESVTLAAYDYLKTLLGSIAQNITVTPLQLVISQVSDLAGSLAAGTFAESLIQDIMDIIAGNPKPEIKYPDLRWVNPSLVVWHNLYQDEKDDTQRLVTNHIDSRYFLLEYDRAVCERDVGLIIDAISYDLMFGSNFRTITAGLAYSRGTASVVNSVQKTATIDAFTKLKQLLIPIVDEQGDSSSANTVSDLMDIILDILVNGSTAAPPVVIPNPTGYDVQLQRARDLIEANREFIKAEVIESIGAFAYDEAKCARDIDFIINALYYDMTYGGNLETLIAGRAYYSFGGTVIPGEEAATLAAYDYLKELVIDIAQNNDVAELQSVVAQVTGPAGDLASANIAGDLIEVIRTIISTPDNEPAAVTPSLGWVESIIVARATALVLSKDTVKTQVTDYIDSNYNTNVVPFTYDEEKCKRDVGLIVDALSWDAMFGSNFRSITAGRAYLRANASVVLDRQKQATIEAYEILKDYVAGLVSDNATAVQSVTDNMDMIIDIFDQGLTAVPEYVIPTPYTLDEGIRRARDLIEANREFIKEEVIKYISDNQQSSLGYDKEICQRDVGLIIDAVGYDLMFGSNFRSITAGRSYYREGAAVVTSVQKAATLDAFNYLKSLLVAQVLGNSDAEASITSNMDIIIDILDTGLLSVPAYEIPNPSGYDDGYKNARDQIDVNRAFISAEVIKYIEVNYPLVYASFDQVACERDIGYIIDAIYYDLTYGGNLETLIAGNAYYSNAALQLGAGEKAATIAAYGYMQDVISDVAQEITVTPLQLIVAQDVSGTAGSVEAAAAAESLISVIINIIDVNIAPAASTPSVAWVRTDFVDRFTALQSNKDNTKLQVTDYIDNYYPFSYNRETCQRDVALILDAVGYDLMFGSNFRSITAGRSYYREGAAVVTSLQKAATIDAFTYLKDLIINTVSSNATAITRATDSMNIIIDILTNGLGSIPTVTLPEPVGYPVGFRNARNLIESNRAFIGAEVIKYIEVNYPAVYASFDQVACERDIGYILDAVRYDMTYGGNMETMIAGNAYYSNSVLQLGAGEQTATLAAYAFMKTLIINVAQNIDVVELQIVVPQATGTAGTLTAANAAGQLIEDIRSIISNPSSQPATSDASTTWVSPGLVTQFNTLQSNTNLIAGQVTHYIDVEYVEPEYNQAKCRRDMDLILDAVYYDTTYGGNMETAIAANSYFVGAVTQIPGEVEATLDAYAYMKTLVEDVARNFTVSALQQSVPQVFGINGSAAAATAAGQLIEDIRTVIDTGVLITNPTEASVLWVSPALVDSYTQLQDEKENVKLAVADYIDSKFFLLTYNRDKCKRDIGYIIDALGYDVMFDSNFRSIVSARSYYRVNAALVVAAQKSATIGSLRRLKEIAIVVAEDNLTAVQRIEDRIELMVDIINRGTTVIPVPTIPNPVGFDSGKSNARALIESNRAFIKAEVIKFIQDNYPAVYASFDQTLCERDIDYILDAVYYDVTYTTNAESLVAGRSYYAGAVVQVGAGELTATLAAYGYMKTIMGQIALNTNITELQVVVPQVFGTAGSSAASLEIESLIEDIIDYITTPNSPPALRAANTAWVSSGLVEFDTSLQSFKETIKTQVQQFIDTKYSYSQATCARDIGYILDATVYDQLYGGNSQTFAAAETYYSAGIFQIGGRERLMTANTFKFLKFVAGSCLLNIAVTPLQSSVGQNLSIPAAGTDEVIKSNELFKIVAEIVENGFTSIVTLNENIPDFDPQFPDQPVTFHQYSLITASGQTFEWVGAGINVNTSLPYLGGQPIAENKAVETNGGKVYWTGTDQFGDFNIGGELVIRRDSGTIEGRTFTKSLFAVLTPYILAVGE